LPLASGICRQYRFIKMWRVFREFLQFLREEKKWWLLPIVLVLLALAALIVFSGGSVFAPLLYPFM
jgi:hypothetical protein